MAGNALSGLFSLFSGGKKSKEVTENALSTEYKRKEFFRIIRNVLIILVVATALITDVLGYIGIFPITVDGARVTGWVVRLPPLFFQ